MASLIIKFDSESNMAQFLNDFDQSSMEPEIVPNFEKLEVRLPDGYSLDGESIRMAEEYGGYLKTRSKKVLDRATQ